MRYPLPGDTAAIGFIRNHNLGLALDKYLQINNAVNPVTDPIGSPAEQESWKIEADTKKRASNRFPSLSHVAGLISAAGKRTDALLAGLGTRGRQFRAVTDYRLAVGFGAEHVLETSLCLHRIYGFPIIPGSAVKGVTRARAFWDIAERLKLQIASTEESQRRDQRKQKTPLYKLDDLLSAGAEKERERLLRALTELDGKRDPLCSDEARALDLNGWLAIADDFYQTFGTTEQRGKVTFFDAYPVTAPSLEPDILNPHYGPYYSDKSYRTPPADYHELKSITYFLTVGKGAEFRFAIAGKEQSLVDLAEDWLRRALQDLGVGGKTAAGYGVMRLKG